MRVLLVTDWTANEGGVQRHVLDLRGWLRDAGEDVSLLTVSVGTEGRGVADHVAYGTERMAPQLALQLVNPSAVARVREAVRTFRPDVVHVHMFELHLSPAIFFALRSVPTVLTVHWYKPICPLGTKLLPDDALCSVPPGLVCWRSGCVSLPAWLRDRPRYALIGSALRRVDRVVACSAWMQAQLARHGIASDHLPLPVRAPTPGFGRVPAARPTFVFAGRLVREKGVDVLLRAFARVRERVPDARLDVVGEGPDRAALQRQARDLGLGTAVRFAGELEAEDMEARLAPAWAVVVPSRWAEPFGLVAVEAIARGVPVVASAVGGLAETVDDGATGLLHPNGDVEALAACLERIADGSALPGGGVPAEASARVRDRHDVEGRVGDLRRLYADVRRARARSAAA